MRRVLAVAGVAIVAGALAPAAAPRVPDAGPHPALAAGPGSAGQNTARPGQSRPGQISATAEWEWWNDPDIRKELKLSDEKAGNLQAIFQRRVAEIQPLVGSLNRERDKLNRMTNDRVADEATYSLQVAKVEWLAARFRESRTIMLYRMFRELDPDQFKKLQGIIERRFSQNRMRGSGGGR